MTAIGGRIGQIIVAGQPLLVDRPDPGDASMAWGSFPMAPWVGRVRNGRFRFLGDDIRLDLNHEDGTGTGGGPIVPPIPASSGPIGDADRPRHAIHGTTFSRRWTPVAVAGDRVELTCALEGAFGWPFAGVARQVVSLMPHRVDLTLAVEPAPDSVFPASLGWHPWFAKPDRLEFHPIAMYARDDLGLPTGELVEPSAPPWDDCFVNHDAVEMHYDRDVAPVVTVWSPDCDHWVVYDKPTHATCVEPQSGPPDAPTIRPELATSAHPLRRTMTIAW